MNQNEKIVLKNEATEMVAEALENKGFEAIEVVEGLAVEMKGEIVVFKAIVKKATFDLKDAVQEKLDKEEAKAEREAARAKRKAEKEAKKAKKEKAE